MKTLHHAFLLFLMLTLITGVFYPLFIFFCGQILFPGQANGSLLRRADQSFVGSALLAQKFESERFFWPRPSAGDYATLPSVASNLGPTSHALKEIVAKRRAAFAASLPEPAGDLLTASGSGLDPHISPLAAEQQVARVAAARKRSPEEIRALILTHTAPRQFGCLGEPRVNVLMLNLALEELP